MWFSTQTRTSTFKEVEIFNKSPLVHSSYHTSGMLRLLHKIYRKIYTKPLFQEFETNHACAKKPTKAFTLIEESSCKPLFYITSSFEDYCKIH